MDATTDEDRAEIAALENEKRDRAREWKAKEAMYGSKIFELYRYIRRLENEIRDLEAAAKEDAEKMRQAKGSFTTDSSDEEGEFDDFTAGIRRQESRIQIDMKVRKLYAVIEDLKVQKALLKTGQEHFEALNMHDDRRIAMLQSRIWVRANADKLERERKERERMEKERRDREWVEKVKAKLAKQQHEEKLKREADELKAKWLERVRAKLAKEQDEERLKREAEEQQAKQAAEDKRWREEAEAFRKAWREQRENREAAAKQREEEEAAVRKREEEAAIKKREEEAAIKQREEEELALKWEKTEAEKQETATKQREEDEPATKQREKQEAVAKPWKKRRAAARQRAKQAGEDRRKAHVQSKSVSSDASSSGDDSASCKHTGCWTRTDTAARCPDCGRRCKYLLQCPECPRQACLECQRGSRPRNEF